MKLVVGKYCNRCKYVEDHIDKKNVEIIDVDSVEAMTLMALNEMLTSKPVTLPLLFISDTNYLVGNVDSIVKEINKVVNV